MSTFHGKLEEFQNISIDNFIGDNLQSTLYLLSHCHFDHMRGIEYLLPNLKKRNVYLYGSDITITILKKWYPGNVTNLISLEQGVKHLLNVPKTNQILFVTLIPAGHCPGSVMFLFEGEKRVLYTGDIRLRVSEMKKNKSFYDLTNEIKVFDRIYLDTTFFMKKYMKFPTRDESLDELLNLISSWIKKSKKNLVRFEIPSNIGLEFLFMEIYKHFKTQIHVSERVYNVYKHIPEMDNIVTRTNTNTQIHSSCGIVKRRNNFCQVITEALPENVITIKPACFTWMNHDFNNGIIEERGKNNYCVCYSSHCSYEELIDILKFLKPKDVYPCVRPKCDKEKEEMKDLIEGLLREMHGEEEENVQETEGKTKWVVNDETDSDSWEENDFNPFGHLNEPQNKVKKL